MTVGQYQATGKSEPIDRPTRLPTGVVAVPVGERFALIDASDAVSIAAYRWYALVDENGTTYAIAVGPARTRLYMHRLVVGAPRGIEVDHRNCDGLDNRRDNLRLATHSQNSANSRKSGWYGGRPTSSIYKGVYKHGQCAGWQAKITVNGKQRHLGMFADEVDAARAYNAAALEAFGEFARLNDIPDEVSP